MLNAYLVKSRIVRRALYEALVLEHKPQAVLTICEALQANALFRDAGMESDHGSLSDPTYPGEWDTVDLSVLLRGY